MESPETVRLLVSGQYLRCPARAEHPCWLPSVRSWWGTDTEEASSVVVVVAAAVAVVAAEVAASSG